MSPPEHPFALGSASPRRRDILTDLRIPFFVCPAHIDETPLPGEVPEVYLERIVVNKLTAVRRLVDERQAAKGRSSTPTGSEAPVPYRAILVADTIVVLDDRIVGKPEDEEQAYQTVKSLSGREHIVLTRYAIGLPAAAPGQAAAAKTVQSRVTLRGAGESELRRYAHTGEGLDKAGAYAVQGIGSFLVETIAGSFSNVVGLPACEIVLDLQGLGLLADFPHTSVVSGVGR